MKKMEIAICDLDADYILKFANYLMSKVDISVHIFTTTEGFYEDATDFDLTILTEEFNEIVDFRSKGKVGHKYVLSENKDSEEEGFIYKFQAVDIIIDEIVELRKIDKAEVCIRKSNEKSKLIGVYSPIDHELQLPFSMALGQLHKTEGKVFTNLI